MSRAAYWGLVGCLAAVALLGVSGSGACGALHASAPPEIDCAELLDSPVTGRRLRVVGCVVDLRSVGYYQRDGDGPVDEVLALVRPPGSDGTEPVRAVWKTRLPAAVAVIERGRRDEEDDAAYDRFLERYDGILWSERIIEGRAIRGSLSEHDQGVRDVYGDRVAPGYALIEPSPDLTAAWPFGLAVAAPAALMLVVIVLAQIRWTRRRRELLSG